MRNQIKKDLLRKIFQDCQLGVEEPGEAGERMERVKGDKKMSNYISEILQDELT